MHDLQQMVKEASEDRADITPRTVEPKVKDGVMAVIFALCFCMWCAPCLAGQSEADAAVAAILFEQNMENASYNVRPDGFVDILFGPAVLDSEYSRLLNLLKHHPDIPGVLAGKGKSNYCPIK
jgi:hypothetical protein